jgi:hypothetical protein
MCYIGDNRAKWESQFSVRTTVALRSDTDHCTQALEQLCHHYFPCLCEYGSTVLLSGLMRPAMATTCLCVVSNLALDIVPI